MTLPVTSFMEEKYEQMQDSHTYVPEHIRDAVVRWVEHGINGGSFLNAVVTNDLREACGRADERNSIYLRSIVAWFYNYAPSNCWGSREVAESWKGLQNLEVAA